MGLFGNLLRRHQADDREPGSQLPESPSVTVSQVLEEAGFPHAVRQVSPERRVSQQGFQVFGIRSEYPDAVCVIWHFTDEGTSPVFWKPDPLGDCAATLRGAGYAVEFAGDEWTGHLVAWTRGEF